VAGFERGPGPDQPAQGAAQPASGPAGRRRLVDVGPRTLQWSADAPLWLDLEQFERAQAEGRLEDAVALYTGELLEGSYDDWLVDERERLARLHLEALEDLARRHAHHERWPQAIRDAERLVAGDPLREGEPSAVDRALPCGR
jgi:hypothetical protein